MSDVENQQSAATPAPAVQSSLEGLQAASDAAAVQTKIIPVPEFGGREVELWGISAPDRQEMWATCYTKVPAEEGADGAEKEKSIPVYGKLYPFLLTRGVRDPVSKARVYQGRHADPDYINSRDPALIDRFVSGIFELSGLGADAVEKEKNGFKRTESGGTSSASPVD